MPKIPSPREIELSNQIVQFLKKDLIFSIFKVEKTLNIPEGTLARCLSEKASAIIPSKHLFNLIMFFSQYGLKIDGYSIEIAEENTLVLSKLSETNSEIYTSPYTGVISKETFTIYRKPAKSLTDLL